MKDKIEEFLKTKEQLTEELKIWVKDKSIPLEERWEVFIKSELGEQSDFYEDFVHIESDEYNPDGHFHIDRHELITVQEILERAQEANYYSKEIMLDTEEKIIEFKEEVLSKFIYSFENDW